MGPKFVRCFAFIFMLSFFDFLEVQSEGSILLRWSRWQFYEAPTSDDNFELLVIDDNIISCLRCCLHLVWAYEAYQEFSSL